MVQQCAGCELPIADKFLFKVLDRVWHANCVQCSDCKCSLSERCFSRDGKLFCRDDFYRRYGTKCSGCDQGISPNDLVRRAKHLVFHVECFVCSSCKRQISTGDELYYVGDGSFICKDDYYQNYQQQTIADVDDDPKDLSYGLDEDLDTALSSKRRGPRTTIKAKQLEALRATFSATPKPSRNIREKLAQETGLNMRVIQVWFQNRRSKERRLKQSGGQTQPSRTNRSSRRSRNTRLENQEETNENDGDLQSPSAPQMGYRSQEMPTSQPQRYMSPSHYDYYSQNSPVPDNMMMGNSQLQHNTDFVSPPSNARNTPLNDMTESNHLASPSRLIQNAGMMGHSPGSNPGYGGPQPAQAQGTCNIINTNQAEVW